MKKLSLCLTIVMLLTIFTCPVSLAGTGAYCRECGSAIPTDSKFCPYCGTKVITSPYSEISKPTPRSPASYSVSFDRGDRSQGQSFKDTKTTYNIFPYEISNCYGCHFYYTASRSNDSTVSCSGTRDVYVRNLYDEINEDDRGWIYVGSFDYDEEGESVEVDLSWYDTDVYAVAIVRETTDSRCSFSASWGDKVTFYYHEAR